MIMGRKTFDSLPGLLPGRRHIVLTRAPDWQAEGAEVAHSVAGALRLAGPVRGSGNEGAEIIALFLPQAYAIAPKAVHHATEGDTCPPEPEPAQYRAEARKTAMN